MGRFNVDQNIVEDAQPSKFSTTFDKYVVALDRDGILCECSDAITGPKNFVPIDNALKAVALIRSKGHKVVILFDQPSIFQKKVTIEQVEDCNRYMLGLLGRAGCSNIDGIWYNTSNLKGDIYAKPKLGLFKIAESKVPGLKISEGVYVGDSIEDLIMANNAGSKPVLILTGNGVTTKKLLEKPMYKTLAKNVKIFKTLLEFAESI